MSIYCRNLPQICETILAEVLLSGLCGSVMRVPFGSFAVCVPAVALSAFFLTSAALLSLCAVSDSFCPAQEVTKE